MSATSPEPFNPEDPFDAMAETIRRGITQVALDAFSTALYRELDSTRQLECFVAGALSGVIGCCFAHVHPDGRDRVMTYIAQCLPAARQVAETLEAHRAKVGK